MKKYLILLMFVATQAFTASSTMAVSLKINTAPTHADGLEQFAGRYKLTQGTNVLFLSIYVENGKLVSKQLWDGLVRPLDHLNGDNYMVTSVGWTVKFIRDKNNKVIQMEVAGHDLWTKVDDTPLNTDAMPANPAEYLGKYQITIGGQTLNLEISLKNGKLWGTQLWDGGNSQLSYTADDSFIVIALGWPIKFIRNSDKKITQLLLNSKDVFTKVNN